MEYDLGIQKVIESINSNSYKKILLQLPDGLKRHANKVQQQIKESSKCDVFIWAGSNFGACDIPLELKNLKFDLIIHFGHSKWK